MDVSPMVKTGARSALTAARESPEALAEALTTVREMLGIGQ
jgi:hypothetical protein